MKKVKVGKSKIHGNGLIADEPIKRGDVIELVHTIREIKPGVTKTTPTLLGRNYNHSDDANALNVIDGNNRYLVALKEIEVGGEITANYRTNPDLEQPESFTSNDNYISFDYDDTLTTPEGFKLAKKLNEEGNNLYVITARDKITPQMIERAEAAGIPKENIITAGSDEAKVKIVKENNISKHIDNKESVIKALGDTGELFAPDKYPDLKTDFVEMDLSDDDLNKLKEGGFIVEEYQDGGEPGDKFKKRLMKRYPGMQGVYGPEGENLNIVKDPNYDARSVGYGDIEFIFPGDDPVLNYPNLIESGAPDYNYPNPSPDKYTALYNPKGANRGDIFLDMMHGMREDPNFQPLLQNFEKAVKNTRGEDMDWQYEGEVENGSTQSKERFDENYVDGQLRAQLAPGTIGMFSHGRKDYRMERKYDSPEMRAAAKDIRNYIKGKYQDGGESKRKKYRFIKDTEEAKQFPVDEWGQYIQEEPEVVVRPLTPEQQQERNMEWARREMARRNPHLYLSDGTLRPQAAQSANWVFAAPMVAPMALEALGSVAATQIPGTGVSLGTVANTAAGIHGATQVPQRIQDWQDVAAGKKDWKEATAESIMTGLELYGGLSELKGFKGVPKELPGSPNSSLELGKASRTVYPQPITNSVGLKQFGQTTYSGPVSVNRTFKGDIYSIKNVRNPEGIPEEQIPYLLGREELMRRYPTDYMSKDELIGYNFKSGLKPVEYPTEIPANFTTQEDIMARILGKPLPSRAKPKVYYDLEGNPISEEEAIRILNTREYAYGGFVNRSKLNRFIK
jgi:hypothetical protein